MPFDPAFPADDAIAYADEQRAQFNALNDQDAALASQIAAIPAGPQGIQGPPGNNGSDGAQGAQGPAGADGRSFNPRGEWNSADTYNRLDMVTYSGTLYVCVVDGMTGTSPGMTSDWVQVQITIPPSSPFPYTGDAIVNGSSLNQADVGVGMSYPGGSGESGLRLGVANNGNGFIPRFAGRQIGSDQYAFAIDGAGIADNMGMSSVQDGDVPRYDAMSQTYKPARNIASRFSDLGPLNITVGDPPSQSDMQTIATRLDEILARLKAVT